MKVYDAAIIGGGHNGLICAAYLARAGKSVVVLESRDVLGGACITEEVWPGYRVSTAAYLCSLLHPQIISDLELASHGLELYRRDPGGFAPFPDGAHLFLYPDADRTRAELLRFAPGDADAYEEFERDIETACDILEPHFLASSPSLDTLRADFTRQGAGHLFEQFFEWPIAKLLEARFASEGLKAVLATDGLIGTAAGVDDPGTSYVLLHHCMGRVLGTRGLWGHVRGGMGRISAAAAAAARKHGAEIRTSAAVRSIEICGDRVKSVVLEDGTEISAAAVAANCDGWTLAGLLPPEHRGALAGFAEDERPNGVSCKINLATSGLPNFRALPGEHGPQHFGTVHLAPTMDHLRAAWADARQGIPSKSPMVEVYLQTPTDPSLAPEGKQILSCFTQYFPYKLASGLDPDAEADAYAIRVLAALEEAAPGICARIEHQQVLTPQRLEERFGLPGGHIFHGDILPERMFGGRYGLRGATTPIRGLYVCGSSAFPGGCVSGVPGFNAARELLADTRAVT